VNIVSVLLITSESLFRFDVSPALAGIVRRESIPGPIKRSNPEYQRLYRLRAHRLLVNLKGTTARAYESHLRAHLLPKLGSLTLTEINTKTVQNFVAYLASGRSRKTVENVLLTLSSILGTAKSWRYACGDLSLTDLTLPRKGVKKEPRSFTGEEMQKLIANAPEPLSTILAVTAVLGLRIGETLALRIGDVDFKQKVIRVRQSVDAATRDVQAVKSDASSADVPLPSQLEARLRTHLQKHEGKSELLFVNRNGRAFSANKLREKQLTRCWRSWAFSAAGFIPCVTVQPVPCWQTGQPRLLCKGRCAIQTPESR
jgi:integrase